MANMSYCKFENTYYDLQKCYDDMDESIKDSQIEARYRIKLIKLCGQIFEDFGEEID